MNIDIYDYQKKALIEAITFYIDVFENDWRQKDDVETLEVFLERLDMDMEELYCTIHQQILKVIREIERFEKYTRKESREEIKNIKKSLMKLCNDYEF